MNLEKLNNPFEFRALNHSEIVAYIGGETVS